MSVVSLTTSRLPKGDERTTVYPPSKVVRANIERAATVTKKRG